MVYGGSMVVSMLVVGNAGNSIMVAQQYSPFNESDSTQTAGLLQLYFSRSPGVLLLLARISFFYIQFLFTILLYWEKKFFILQHI